MEEYLLALQKSELFKGIQSDNLKQMMGCLKPIITNYKKNDYIVTSGNVLDGVGIVLSGAAAVIKESKDGNRHIMKMLSIGDTFGEIVVFSKKNRWPATVIALEKCTVFFLPKNKIISECDNVCPWHRELVRNMLGIVSNMAIMLNKKVEYLTIKSMRAKISKLILELYEQSGSKTFMLPMNRNELADFLNVSRPSMSREMSRMKDEGIIDFHKETIKILDLERLTTSF